MLMLSFFLCIGAGATFAASGLQPAKSNSGLHNPVTVKKLSDPVISSPAIQANRAVVHDPSTGVITITHDSQNGMIPPVAKITSTCQTGGGLTLVLEAGSVTIVGTATIAAPVAETESADNKAKCVRTINVPTAAGTSFSIAKDDGALCGRTKEDSTGTYRWTFTVSQRLGSSGSNIQREFVNPITIDCNIADAGQINTEDVVVEPVVEAELHPAVVNVPVQFLITTPADAANGKWDFEITPENVDALEGQNFRIVDCTAVAPSLPPVPPVDPPVTPVALRELLIEGGCIRDLGVTVTTSTSPTKQTVTVAVFQFVANPTAAVKLQCVLELCDGITCSALTAASESCTPRPATSSARRARRGAIQQYTSSSDWVQL